MSSARAERAADALTAAAAAAGAYWRLVGLGGQVLLDDEWHALGFVPGKTLGALLTIQGVGANSVPSNLWAGALWGAVGWSEAALRLPSVLSGLAALAVLPWLVRRLWGARAAAVFAWLLALSPLAVFYARLCRPYGVVQSFGAAAVLCLLLWRREGGRRWAWAYAACGFVAVVHHLLAAIPVFAPLAALALLDEPAARRRRLLVGAALAAACALSLLPANLSNPWWLHAARGARADARTFLDLTMLWSGSASAAARAAFFLAAACGAAVLRRRDRAAALALAAAGAMFLLHLLTTRQEGAGAAIQAARYGIALLPLLLAMAALGLAEAPAPAVAAAVALLAWTGPLARTYADGSSFAHHSAYQYDYAPLDWSRSRERALYPGLAMSASAVDPCYAGLRGAAGVIEYPLVIGDHLDLLYFFQRVHGRPVKAGYRRAGLSFRTGPAGDGAVYGDMTADAPLSRIPDADAGRLRFSNLVSLDAPERLRGAYRGWAVVVHRDLLHEEFPDRFPDRGGYRPAAAAAADLTAAFGPPACADGAVSVFRVP